MKRIVQSVFALAVIGLAVWLWLVFHPTPEAAIRSNLNSLAKTISFKDGGEIAKAYNAQKAAGFFTTDVEIILTIGGYDPISLHGRDEVQQAVLAGETRLTALKVEFLDMNVTLDASKESAKVNLTGKATVPGQRDISAQEFNFLLKKVDGKWLIYRVETVKTLAEEHTPAVAD
jgi:hypothetical protein